MKIIRELRQEIDRLRAMIGGNIVSITLISFIQNKLNLPLQIGTWNGV